MPIWQQQQWMQNNKDAPKQNAENDIKDSYLKNNKILLRPPWRQRIYFFKQKLPLPNKTVAWLPQARINIYPETKLK